jgi:hypothetical protein
MNDTFITEIRINKLRHLHDLDIKLSDAEPPERKNLILTGKNGSGKTSVLEEMRDFILKKIEDAKEPIYLVAAQPTNPPVPQVDLVLNENNGYTDLFFSYFSAEHNLVFGKDDMPKSIEAITPHSSKDLLKYIIDLDYQRSKAFMNGESEKQMRLVKWFEHFQDALCKIYDEPELTGSVDDDSNPYNYTITIPNRESFHLNEMADGYKALLNIAADIMMRMEGAGYKDYTIPGIVLIDEIEAHLHVSMQKKALPMLTAMFPNIQFIVTTHSPFVMASLKDKAVIYDLEIQHPYMLAEEKSLGDIIRENLGVSSTMPLWAEEKLDEILAKYAPLKSNELSMAKFKQELKDAGLADLFLDSLPRLMEGR